MVKKLGTLLQEIIYPRFCCHCRGIGWYLCPRCQLLCEFAFAPPALPAPTNLKSIMIAFSFTPPISEVIKTMKYQYIKGIADWLGELLYFHTNYPDVDVVTSVPITAEKRRLRGFNQAERIARSFCFQAQLSYVELLKKPTSSKINQASLIDLRDRLTNVQQTYFECVPIKKFPAKILLIDDVYTTGRTLEACAAQLLEHGVQEVHGLVVAHGR